MEFGCRYIYVDESRGDNTVQLESHLSPVAVSQNGAVLSPRFYDRIHPEEKPRNDADVDGVVLAVYDSIHQAEGPEIDAKDNGLQHCIVYPKSNVGQDLQPISPAQLEDQKISPPVPQRRKISPVSTPPGPQRILSPESNTHVSLRPTSSVQLNGCKTPPPVPSRRQMSTNSEPNQPHRRLPPEPNTHMGLRPKSPVQLHGQKTPPPVPAPRQKPTISGMPSTFSPSSMHHATREGQTEQPTILISPTAENSRPPIPDRTKKPSIYKPSGVPDTKTQEYDYADPEDSTPGGVTWPQTNAYEYADCEDLSPDGVTWPQTRAYENTDVGDSIPDGVSHAYEDADCEDSNPDELSQGVSMAPNDQNYLEVLPAVSTEMKMPTTSVNLRDHPMANSPNCMAPNDQNYLEVLPAVSTEMKRPTSVNLQDHPVATSPVPPTERLPANCNILLLNIGKMVENSDIDIGESPLLCSGCSATCSKLNHVDNTKKWTCVFCAALNHLSDDSIFKSREEGDELYAGDSQSGNEYSFDDQPMVIFCIDISGSMSVTTEVTQEQSNDNILYKTRMEAVKSALDQTLDFLHKQNSEKRVALVTFSDQVKLYGDGTVQPLVLHGDELLDPDYLKARGEGQPMPLPLAKTLQALKGVIQCLKEKGATALGPAALVSIAMASKSPGSKVIICTDGRANTDLGNLEDISEEYVYQSSKLYYSNLGDLALQHSVVVSVVTIEGTNCRLPELGQLADKTGGKVNIVHPFNLANEFQSIMEEEIIATDVKLRVFLPQTMYFLYEGNNESVLEKTFGSITSDTVLSTEFDIHSSKIKEVLRYSQLPIQVHLTYTLPDGRSRRRILSQKRPVTNDGTTALESIDLNVLQIHSVQFSARLAMEGHVNEARTVALELKELIDLVMRHEKYEAHGAVYEEWETCMAPIYEDLQGLMKNSSKETEQNSQTEIPVVKTFSDEMAKMMFHMKRAKKKVLSKLRN